MFINRTEKDGIVSCLFKSSNILASDYDQKNKELVITFKGGRQYVYSGIEYKDYLRFEIAESQGQVFNKHIKKYQTKRNQDIDTTDIMNKISMVLNEQQEKTQPENDK